MLQSNEGNAMKKHHLAEYQEKRSAETKRKVSDYFHDNPFSNARACAQSLGINYQTVLRHVKAIKAEVNG